MFCSSCEYNHNSRHSEEFGQSAQSGPAAQSRRSKQSGQYGPAVLPSGCIGLFILRFCPSARRKMVSASHSCKLVPNPTDTILPNDSCIRVCKVRDCRSCAIKPTNFLEQTFCKVLARTPVLQPLLSKDLEEAALLSAKPRLSAWSDQDAERNSARTLTSHGALLCCCHELLVRQS